MADKPEAGKVRVRTTMRPQESIDVSKAEAVDLRRQNLLETDNAEVRKLEEKA